MPYAKNTVISVEKSLAEIVAMIKKAGAERIAQAEEPEHLTIQFFLQERMLRFRLALKTWQDLPDTIGYRYRTAEDRQRTVAQMNRQRARGLLLVIKAKLESVESGIETFDEAFLANIVTPDGMTIGQLALPQIKQAYEDGRQPRLLQIEGNRS